LLENPWGCAVVTFQKLGYPFKERKNKQGNRWKFYGFFSFSRERYYLCLVASLVILFFVLKHEFCCKSKILMWRLRILHEQILHSERYAHLYSRTKWSPKCCVVEVRSSHRDVTKEGPVEAMKVQWNFLSTPDLLSC
jgi:hypothetical protein